MEREGRVQEVHEQEPATCSSQSPCMAAPGLALEPHPAAARRNCNCPPVMGCVTERNRHAPASHNRNRPPMVRALKEGRVQHGCLHYSNSEPQPMPPGHPLTRDEHAVAEGGVGAGAARVVARQALFHPLGQLLHEGRVGGPELARADGPACAVIQTHKFTLGCWAARLLTQDVRGGCQSCPHQPVKFTMAHRRQPSSSPL